MTMYPLTRFQKELWLLQSKNLDNGDLNISEYWIINDVFDEDRLIESIQKLIKTTSCLHYQIFESEKGIFQKEFKTDKLNLEIKDFTSENRYNEKFIQHWMEKDTKIPINLSKDFWYKCCLIKVKDNTYYLYFKVHHIAIDGYSMNLLRENLMKIYNKNITSEELEALNDLKNIAEYEEKYKNSEQFENDCEFWKNEFNSDLIPVSLHRGDKVVTSYYSSKVSIKLPKLNINIPHPIVFMSIFIIYLKYLKNEKEIIIGFPINDRNNKNVVSTPGMNTNIIPLKILVEDNDSIKSISEKIIEKLSLVSKHERYSGEDISRNIRGGNKTYGPIINILPFRNTSLIRSPMEVRNLSIGPIEDISFNLHYQGNHIDVLLDVYYNKELYKCDEIKNHLERICGVYTKTNQNQLEKRINEINFLTAFDRRKINEYHKSTRLIENKNENIIDKFKAIVFENMDKIAVKDDENSLTYKKLDEYSTMISNAIIKIKKDNCENIGLMMDSSIKMIATILAILKLGKTYVPIDPSAPIERINYIIRDSKIKLIISNEYNTINIEDTTYININNIESDLSELKTEFLNNDNGYIIYTSGTTGNPKGVKLSQQASIKVYNHLFENNIINEDDIFVQFASPTFDAYCLEVFTSLLVGGTLIIPSYDKKIDPNNFEKFINKENVTFALLPPTYTNQLNAKNLKKLKTLLTGGSSTSAKIVNDWSDKVRYINAYGPTENGIITTMWEANCKENISIGKPIIGDSVLIVNEKNQILPPGSPGELLLNGPGLMTEYLNLKELTKKSFVSISNKKYYKSGDIGYWDEFGNIIFLGRKDNQIQVRGYRVELEEILNKVYTLNSIKEAQLTLTSKEELALFYTTEDDGYIEDIRNRLSKILPNYMIPHIICKVNEFPINERGKINFTKLMEKATQEDIVENIFYPQNYIEETLNNAWKEILNVSNVPTTKTFYDLGGDSIKAIQITSFLRKHGIQLKVGDVMNYPYINSQIKKVKHIQNREKSNDTGIFPLSPIQAWYFSSKTFKDYFNQSVMIKFKKDINFKEVIFCLNQIIEHHNSLRSDFSQVDGDNRCQQVKNFDETSFIDILMVENIDEKTIENLILDVQKSIAAKNSKLLKAIFIKNKAERFLYIATHHLIMDLVSWRIILNDIKSILSEGYCEKEYWENDSDSYEKWVKNLYNYPINKEKNFWSNIRTYELECMNKEGKILDINHNYDCEEKIILNSDTTNNLLYNSNQVFNTNINQLLLAALTMSLNKWKSIKRVTINLESHGRHDYNNNVDVSNTVGWFTNQYPFILNYKPDIKDQIFKIKDDFNNIPNNGIGYGIAKFLFNYDLPNYHPDISFNYFGSMNTNYSNDIFELIKIPDSRDSSKNNIRNHKLEIYGFEKDGEIKFNINYSYKQFDSKDIKEFSLHFKNSIIEIVNYCCNRVTSEISCSDVKLINIDNKKLNLVKNKTKNIGDVLDIMPLTPIQKGMYFHNKKDEVDPYYDSVWFTVEYDLDIVKLKNIILEIISQEEALNTRFYTSDISGDVVQIVFQNLNHIINYQDLSNQDYITIQSEIDKEISSSKNVSLDLLNDNLIKIMVYKLSHKKYKVVIFFHHIIMDGWSSNIFINKIFNAYVGNEIKDNNKQVNASFKDYIEHLNITDDTASELFWENYLRNYNNTVTIPYEKKTNNDIKDTKCHEFYIGEENTARLNDIAQKNNVTLSTVFSVIWGILLQKYNNVDDVVFGAITSGRTVPIENIDKIIGPFINTIPMRIKAEMDETFNTLVYKVQKELNKMKDHENHPLYKIQNTSIVKSGLINNIFMYENQPSINNLEIKDLSIYDINGFEQTNYNFNVKISPSKNMKITFNYNNYLYSIYSIVKIQNHLLSIIKRIIENSNILIREIDYRDDEDIQFLELFNNNSKEINNKSFNQIFKNIVANYSDCIALKYGDDKLSYKVLDELSNKLANYLKRKGIEKNSIIPVITEKNVSSILSIITIWKLGCIYVPIDNSYPIERKKFILEESGSSHVLVNNSSQLPRTPQLNLLNIEQKDLWSSESPQFFEVNTSGDDLAYIIYTSGTTGKPKGVKISHENIANLNIYLSEVWKMNSSDRIAQFANLSFDASLWDVFSAFLNGGTLCVPKTEEIRDNKLFEKFIIRNNITTLSLTPSFATYLNPEKLPSLKRVVTSGSSTSHSLINKWSQHVKYYNGYGPTENTICTTMWMAQKISNNDTIPIGEPIPNNRIYILNQHHQPHGIGIPGEICIAGKSLSSGYFKNLDLTNKKFISTQDLNENKIYLTGDIGKFNEAGFLEFLGRKDEQLKVRGFRVEIGEIETALSTISTVKECCVLPINQNNEICLIAYLVLNKKSSIDISEMKNLLKEKLPHFMIPDIFIKVSSMPYTHNGKIDKKKLSTINQIDSKSITSPENPLQSILLEIFCKVLRKNNLSLSENLFDNGLHSIRTLEAMNMIENELSISLTYSDIAESKNILKLEGLIRSITKYGDNKSYSYYKNSSGVINLFAFPTGLGMGLTFNRLINHLSGEISLYTTDFNPYDLPYDDMINRYVDDIIKINGRKSVNLLGYCAGGNLAFEIAKKIEEKNIKVEKLILLDTTKRNDYVNKLYADKSYIEDGQEFLPKWAKNKYVKQKFERFKAYLEQLSNVGKIKADIFHIRVDTNYDSNKDWKNMTSGSYVEILGEGSHDTMLDMNNIYDNANIINSILENEGVNINE
ncbi:hypothetical protein JPSP13_16130 [Staphylococcus pseudintermedius]|uniref:amino acid adenylation domain-containing protein n=1 Tax=Staphylococcus pseudintermedius TaxID=283734 RepID=UPI0036F43189